MEPFYFKSYDKTLGRANNLEELYSMMQEIEKTDPSSLKYHLENGNIYTWLLYIKKKQLAQQLKNISEPEKAIEIIGIYLSKGKKKTKKN